MMLHPAVLAIGCAALLSSRTASAQTCTASASGLMFGTYDPFAPAASAITGTVSVNCQALVAISVVYSIQLGAGTGGSFAARSMAVGSSRLTYQLYTNSARSVVWGDGTGGTGVVGDGYLLLALGSATKSYTAYGVVPARQIVAPGAYADVLTVLVSY